MEGPKDKRKEEKEGNITQEPRFVSALPLNDRPPFPETRSFCLSV